jgi:hypothetical protein
MTIYRYSRKQLSRFFIRWFGIGQTREHMFAKRLLATCPKKADKSARDINVPTKPKIEKLRYVHPGSWPVKKDEVIEKINQITDWINTHD